MANLNKKEKRKILLVEVEGDHTKHDNKTLELVHSLFQKRDHLILYTKDYISVKEVDVNEPSVREISKDENVRIVLRMKNYKEKDGSQNFSYIIEGEE